MGNSPQRGGRRAGPLGVPRARACPSRGAVHRELQVSREHGPRRPAGLVADRPSSCASDCGLTRQRGRPLTDELDTAPPFSRGGRLSAGGLVTVELDTPGRRPRARGHPPEPRRHQQDPGRHQRAVGGRQKPWRSRQARLRDHHALRRQRCSSTVRSAPAVRHLRDRRSAALRTALDTRPPTYREWVDAVGLGWSVTTRRARAARRRAQAVRSRASRPGRRLRGHRRPGTRGARKAPR